MALRSERGFRESLPAGFDGFFDWDFLRGAFGPTIEPMDFDAVVERNRHLLIYETKEPGVEIPDGQRRALDATIQIPRSVTVLRVHGKSPATFEGYEVWWRRGARGGGTLTTPTKWARWSRERSSGRPPVRSSPGWRR